MSIRKPFIAVANPCAKDNHQYEFLKKLDELGTIVWCRDFNDIPYLITKASIFISSNWERYDIAVDLKRYLKSLE